jgi:pimeloyl-ACP methyl ester carboxylesterase
MFEDRLFAVRAPDAPGGALSVRRKRRLGSNTRRSPVLIVHGATFGAALFDLPSAGYSLMAALAVEGRPIYALDIRGYGRSLGPGVMDEPPDRNPPFADADAAVADIRAVAAFILDQQLAPKLDLIGFSWGTIPAARFAGENPDRVAHLALYAPIYAQTRPIWIGVTQSTAGETRPLGAYRLVSETSIAARWDADVRAGQAPLFRDDHLPPLLFATFAALDPRARSHDPPAFRCPNGALKDLMGVFAGRRLFDPGKLTMPVLLVRGEQDLTSSDVDARNLLSLIASPAKRYRVISPGSHFLCIERHREMLYEEFSRFLDERGGNP